MRVGGRDIDTPRAVLGALAVAVLGMLIVGSATSTAAFGAYNPAWEGTSDVRAIADDAGVEATVATNATSYEAHGEGTIAVVLAPEEPYTEAEIARIKGFLERGGTLLVADRDGTGNELLASVGADARVDGAVLRDERNYYRDPALVEATNVSSHPLTEGVDSLTFNYGTTVDPGGATVLASGSSFGYLDENGNGELDAEEELASRPVATVEDVGDGRVIVVGDPSAFINVMAERPGNRAFLENVFRTGDAALIDTTHSGGVPPLVAVLLAVRGSAPVQMGLVGVGLLVVFGWQRGLHEREERDPVDGRSSAEALAESAADRYPDFDRSRLRRIMKGIKLINSKRGDDE